MPRRSINVIQFWMTIAFFAIPGIAFYIASYVRFQSEVFDNIEVDDYAYFGFTILVTILWALVVEHPNRRHDGSACHSILHVAVTFSTFLLSDNKLLAWLRARWL